MMSKSALVADFERQTNVEVHGAEQRGGDTFVETDCISCGQRCHILHNGFDSDVSEYGIVFRAYCDDCLVAAGVEMVLRQKII